MERANDGKKTDNWGSNREEERGSMMRIVSIRMEKGNGRRKELQSIELKMMVLFSYFLTSTTFLVLLFLIMLMTRQEFRSLIGNHETSVEEQKTVKGQKRGKRRMRERDGNWVGQGKEEAVESRKFGKEESGKRKASINFQNDVDRNKIYCMMCDLFLIDFWKGRRNRQKGRREERKEGKQKDFGVWEWYEEKDGEKRGRRKWKRGINRTNIIHWFPLLQAWFKVTSQVASRME